MSLNANNISIHAQIQNSKRSLTIFKLHFFIDIR
jgi:hypothetical protein